MSDSNRVEYGVVEFNCSFNPGFSERFHQVVNDLRQSASTTDVWLMDIASTLAEFGYTMTITRSPERQAEWEEMLRKLRGAP